PAWKVISSLGIDGLGRSRTKRMMELAVGKARDLSSLDHWLCLTTDDLQSLVDPKVPESFLATLPAELDRFSYTINRLYELGIGTTVQASAPLVVDSANNQIVGRSFCFTGTRL